MSTFKFHYKTIGDNLIPGTFVLNQKDELKTKLDDILESVIAITWKRDFQNIKCFWSIWFYPCHF